jgi:hypothetical protein
VAHPLPPWAIYQRVSYILLNSSRLTELSSPGAGAYQNAMPKAKAKCDKQRLAKLRELTTQKSCSLLFN